MEKSIVDELIEENVEAVLNELEIGGTWMPEFGWYERTGEKELTLKVRIYQQSVDTDEHIKKVEEILKSMGWTYLVAKDVKDAGRVSESDKNE